MAQITENSKTKSKSKATGVVDTGEKPVKKTANGKKTTTAKSQSTSTKKTSSAKSSSPTDKPKTKSAKKSTSTTTKSTRAKSTKSAAKQTTVLSDVEKAALIEKTAYYIAEARGFVQGDPTQDWLLAESRVNQMIQEGSL